MLRQPNMRTKESKRTSKKWFEIIYFSVFSVLVSLIISITGSMYLSKKSINYYFDYSVENFETEMIDCLNSIDQNDFQLNIQGGNFRFTYKGEKASPRVFFLKDEEQFPLFRVECCNYTDKEYDNFKSNVIFKSYRYDDPESAFVSNILFGTNKYEIYLYKKSNNFNYYGFSYYIQGSFNAIEDCNLVAYIQNQGIKAFLERTTKEYLKKINTENKVYYFTFTMLSSLVFLLLILLFKRGLKIKYFAVIVSAAIFTTTSISFCLHLFTRLSFGQLIFVADSLSLLFFLFFLIIKRETVNAN